MRRMLLQGVLRSRRLALRLLLGTLPVAAALMPAAAGWSTEQQPVVHDDRLELKLFAEAPQIVTPIGLAVAADGGVFVIESHTHLRPRDYQGPERDLVKVLRDTDGDGRCDRVTVFAEGLDAAMNLAWSPQGVLYAVCAREVVALHDDDQDGRCDRQERVLRLITNERYPHNCLLGLTFSPDGWMYVSRGNVGGRRHTLRGTDGSEVSGYGDGGNICRCRPDGTRLEEFATGFWNPFDMKFDAAGRLLCVDNDPDARGPNRLVHVVRDGDYGYKSLFGGGGNHPLQAWDGERPGTLPFISGTGEAPSGLWEARRSSLPADYADSLLITIWNENSVELHRLRPHGSSLAADRSTLITGGKNFRPVALGADAQGNLYLSDWVLVDYSNHGQGRIWRLTAKRGEAAHPSAESAVNAAGQRALERLAATDAGDLPLVIENLLGSDAFAQQAAALALARPALRHHVPDLLRHEQPQVRLGALLAAKRLNRVPDRGLLRGLLGDSDELVRTAAMIWCAESLAPELRPELDVILERPALSLREFEIYLSSVRLLQPEFVAAYRGRQQEHARQLPQPQESGLLLRIVRSSAYAPELRALALSRLDAREAAEQIAGIEELARQAPAVLQLAAIRTLGKLANGRPLATLLELARSPEVPEAARIAALWAAADRGDVRPEQILPSLDDPLPSLRLQAARCLTSFRGDPQVTAAVERKLAETAALEAADPLVEQLCFLRDGDRAPGRPRSLEAWHEALARGGDPAAGRYVFHSARATCTKCHTWGGRGGALGPDLSHVRQSLSREQIVQAILRPSEKFPPQYQAWNVLTTDGRVHVGLQLDHQAGGAIELLTTEGRLVHFRAAEIEDYQASPRSLMPDGLEANLSASELRDLIALLAQPEP